MAPKLQKAENKFFPLEKGYVLVRFGAHACETVCLGCLKSLGGGCGNLIQMKLILTVLFYSTGDPQSIVLLTRH